MSRLLDAEEVARQLRVIPGWRRVGTSLRATYAAADVATALRLVAEVGAEAESMDHDPDLHVRGRTVTVRCSTDALGGVTQVDVELAHRAHEWAQRLSAEPVTPTEADPGQWV